MAGALEARLVITAQDDTAKAFNSLKERIASVDKMVATLDKAMAAVGPVAKNVEAFKLPNTMSADAAKLVETVGRVDKTMKDVSRSSVGVAGNIGKASAEVVGLSGRLMDAGAKLKAIGDFKISSRGVNETALALRKAEQDARLLAAKLDGVPNPARSMLAAHAGALAEVRATGQALERQVATAAAARTALAELGVPLNALRTEEERLKSSLMGTNAALLRQIELEKQSAAAAEKAAAALRVRDEQDMRHHKQMLSRMAIEDHPRHEAAAAHGGGDHGGHGFVNYALTSAAMAVSAHEIVSVVREAWHEGAELQHERIQLTNAGRTPEEMREIESAGRSTIQQLPTANYVETMKVIAETTSAFGSVHHAIDNLPFMMKTMEVLKSAGGDKIQGDAGTVGRYFAKTFEERMTKPEEFQAEARMMIPAMVASGGVFNPEQLYGFAQQAKSALPNYDMRFLSKIVPSIVTAMGGQRAGTAANAFNSIIMGKVNDKKQAEAWEKFGLLDNTKVLKKAGNVVSWTAGAVKDTNLALQDPLKWAETVALPAMLAKGVKVDDRLELAKELGTMFRNQNGNMFANEMFQEASRSRLHKDEALYNKTGDLDELYKADLGEFHVGAEALGESLKTLAAATTAPMMHNTAIALSGLSWALNQVSAAGLRHPTIAATAGVTAAGTALAGAGWIGKKLWDGFGLKGSAVALDASAASLEAAAVKLGAAGSLGGAGGAAGAAGKVATGAGIAGAIEGAPAALAVPGAVEVGAAIVAGGIAVGTVGLVKAAFDSQEPGMGGQWSPATAATRADDVQRMQDQQAEADRLKAEIAHNKAMEKIPGGSDPINEPLQRDLQEKLNQVENTRRSIAAVDAAGSHEARVGRAMMAMPRPEEFGPDMPDGLRYHDREAERGRAYAALPRPEEFGPNMLAAGPALPGDDAQRLRYAEQELARSRALAGPPLPDVARRTIGAYIDFARPQAEAGTMPLPTRGGNGPIPVQIVGGPPTASAAPPPFHDGWLDGDRAGIEERSRRGAAMFRQDPEAARGRAMMEHEDVSPHADTSALDQIGAKAEEAQTHLAALSAIVVSPSGNTAGIDAIIAKAREATAALQAMSAAARAGAGGGGGTSGSVGTSYPQTSPVGRQGGPR